jgi:hypothetical protein
VLSLVLVFDDHFADDGEVHLRTGLKLCPLILTRIIISVLNQLHPPGKGSCK